MKRVPDFNLRCNQAIRLLLRKRGATFPLVLPFESPGSDAKVLHTKQINTHCLPPLHRFRLTVHETTRTKHQGFKETFLFFGVFYKRHHLFINQKESSQDCGK